MIGLVAKDFIVFKKICKPAYRLLGIILLLCACIFIPQAAIPYISLLLPLVGVAFLTELVKIEEKSDWKNYLPVLPITDKEIVVGRYLFSGILFVSLSVLTFLLCIIAAFTGHFSFTTVVPNLVLGMCCTVLTICLGVPSGFVFKQSNCTGAMIAAIMVCAVIRSIPPFSPYPHSLPIHCLLSVWHYSSTCPIVRHSAFSEKGVMQEVRWHLMIENNWILCPICRNKTRIKIRGDTVLENFPLYCPKCKQENLIRAYQLNIIVIKEPDAQTQSR